MARAANRLAEAALADLEALKRWHAARGRAHVGDWLVEEIFVLIDALRDRPQRGRVVPEFGRDVLRELIHAPYRIVYRWEGHQVRIVRVLRDESLGEAEAGVPG